MVRKVIALVLCLAAILAVPIAASAATPINDIMDDPAIRAYFEDLISSQVGINDDYVLYFDGVNYILVVGDLSLEDGNIVSVSPVLSYTLNPLQFSSSSSEIDYFFISTGDNNTFYSNLSRFPDLIERTCYYEIATIVLLFVALCIYLFRSIFNFSLRRNYS